MITDIQAQKNKKCFKRRFSKHVQAKGPTTKNTQKYGHILY